MSIIGFAVIIKKFRFKTNKDRIMRELDYKFRNV